MMETTDLDEVKKTANILLYVDPKFDKKIDFVVHHPFFSTTVGVVKKNGTSEITDLTTAEGLCKARLSIQESIQKVDCYSQFLIIINRPYLPIFFQMTHQYLSLNDFSIFLGNMWTYVEFPNADPNVRTDEFVSFFKQADPKLLMDAEDYVTWKALPDEITVYRGISGDGKVKKLSWTRSEEKARWFAERWNSHGRVYRAEIRKEDVLAYFGGRGEDEIVLDPRKLLAIEKI